MREITAVRITHPIDALAFEVLTKLVDSEKAEKVRRFARVQDSERSLIADTLARFLICNKLNIRNGSLVFSKNSYGKPLLEGHTDLHFNVSHSGDWVVCCIDETPVGVDVQEIVPIDTRIVERFFSKKEIQEFFSMSEEARLEHFFDLWTLKESYVKAVGKGFFIPIGSFAVKKGETIEIESQGSTRKWFFKQYNVDSAYKFSVCGMSPEFPDHVTVLDLDVFLDTVLKM